MDSKSRVFSFDLSTQDWLRTVEVLGKICRTLPLLLCQGSVINGSGSARLFSCSLSGTCKHHGMFTLGFCTNRAALKSYSNSSGGSRVEIEGGDGGVLFLEVLVLCKGPSAASILFTRFGLPVSNTGAYLSSVSICRVNGTISVVRKL